MEKKCAVSGQSFEVSEEDLQFYSEVSPRFNENVCQIPAPTLCPAERRRRRLSFRNERSYYKRNCDKCKQSFIGSYSPNKSYTVYCSTCWWGDAWDAQDYGRDFDFSRPFFDQFHELMLDVPRLGTINVNAENSDYTSYGYSNKDCYLLSTCDYNEKCYYGCFVWKSYQCVDCLSITECRFCYQCIDCDTCYESQYCSGCTSCTNCFACTDCKNLKNCFGCVGLMNKEYCFFNEQLTQEEYEKRVNEALDERKETLQKIEDFATQFPRRASIQINCENCVGDHLKNCKNVYWGFDGYGAEDCKWISNFPGNVHHCYDFDGAGEQEWSLETIASGAPGNHILFSDHIFNGSDIFYSSYCIGSKDSFGSIGLFNKQYYVFNKGYSKDEYEDLVPRIIEHMKDSDEWGQFFPVQLSPFGYNETLAQQVFPMAKDEVLKNCWKLEEVSLEAPKASKVLPASQLPQDIDEIPDDILNWAIECEVSKKPFKIIPQELDFYRKYHLPIPHLHPEERHKSRMTKRNPQFLWERSCSNCQKKIMSSYSPECEVPILCEACYLEKVY